MADELKKWRVKPGHWFGPGNQYQAGDVVDLTDQEASAFLDKLEPVVVEKPKVAPQTKELKPKPAAKKPAKKDEDE